MTSFITRALVALLFAVPLRAALPQQRINPDLGDLAKTPEVVLPQALSRAELARRLKKLDGSLPDVLPAGNAVVLGPGRLTSGRATLALRQPSQVRVARSTPVAEFYTRDYHKIAVEFDAAAGAFYALDFVTTGTRHIGEFELRLFTSGSGEPAIVRRAPSDPGGHQLFYVNTPRAGRWLIEFQYNPELIGGALTWQFFQVELLRVR